MSRFIVFILGMVSLGAAFSSGQTSDWQHARQLYQRTEYRASMEVLSTIENKDTSALKLMGQDYFMLGEYSRATEFLERAAALAPADADCLLWLGRAFGRRAETSGPFTAPGYAAKSRQMFERAVALSPGNREAIGDLFDYYLQAPRFLGGGENKAAALVTQVERIDPAEGHYYQALLAEKHREYDRAEEHLRAALELAPRQLGRLLALATYLAKRGRASESDALFEQAERLAPAAPKVLFERAQACLETGRKQEARHLLERYLQSPVTPSDPPKSGAEALLRKIGA